jgi:hypothetical protein
MIITGRTANWKSLVETAAARTIFCASSLSVGNLERVI